MNTAALTGSTRDEGPFAFTGQELDPIARNAG